MQSDKLKKLIKEVKEESSPIVKYSNDLIETYVKDLDEAISDIDKIITLIGEDSIENIPDEQIEYYCLKIPSLMYFAGVKVEELGMQADLATNKKKNAFNEAILNAVGTVPEKKAQAEKDAEMEALAEAIYKRAYNTLKVKLDMAEKVYSGLKKALSKRIAEVDLDRFSKDKYIDDTKGGEQW